MRSLALILALSCAARADEPFRYDWRIDASVTVVGLWGWIASENAKHEIVSESCHFCERDAEGRPTLDSFDAAARNALRLSNPAPAESASNALGYAVGPLLLIGSGLLAAGADHRLKDYPVDLLLFAQSAVLAADVNQVVKFAVARERPFVHFTTSADAARSVALSDSLTSFYSGHTTLLFSMATAAGTIASMRHYRLAPLVWAFGMTMAATVGYLRIAADRHYLSDVLAGAGVGSLIGFVNPYFVHRRGRVRPSIQGVAGGALLAVGGDF